jgi:hypothetical protein
MRNRWSHKARWVWCLVAVGLISVSGTASAATVVYGLSTGGTLSEFDLSDGSKTTLATLTPAFWTSLEPHPTLADTLVAMQDDATLAAVNIISGIPTPISTVGISGLFFSGLAYDPNDSDVLYLQDEVGQETFTYDFSSSTFTSVASSTPQLSGIDFVGNDLYGVTYFSSQIYRLVGSSWVAVGSPGMGAGVNFVRDLAASNGSLFVITDGGQFYRIDPSTGVATLETAVLMNMIGNGSVDGIVVFADPLVAAVPEPSTLALLGLGTFCLVGSRRRRNPAV